jgi:hypothetical protein
MNKEKKESKEISANPEGRSEEKTLGEGLTTTRKKELGRKDISPHANGCSSEE